MDGCMDSWVVSHSALNIGTLWRSPGHEFEYGDDKLFIGPKHNIYTNSWFYLV